MLTPQEHLTVRPHLEAWAHPKTIRVQSDPLMDGAEEYQRALQEPLDLCITAIWYLGAYSRPPTMTQVTELSKPKWRTCSACMR